MDKKKIEDYRSRIKRARNRRNGKDPTRLIIICLACVVLVAVVAVAGIAVRAISGAMEARQEAQASLAAVTATEGTMAPAETTLSPEEESSLALEAEIESVVDGYENLGIVNVSGYLNMRETPSTDGKIIGKLLGGSACEIVNSDTDGWYQISSGGLNGYISSEFVLTGDEARTAALEEVEYRAIVTADKLNVRTEPREDAEVVGQIVQNERYVIEGEENGWVKIPSGYVSADYVEKRYALNEARELDVKTMVLNMYDKLGVSNVNNYLNIRDTPSEEGKIIGKLPGKAGAEVLEEADGWYKIKSGPVTGYVRADYLMTGTSAQNAALQNAKLMAIVSTDGLNVRTEPNTEATIWTQISNSERYDVVSQQDGWVGIQLDDEVCYVANQFVDVRYALNEAIKYSPVVETTGSSSGNSGSSSSGSSSSSSTGSKKNSGSSGKVNNGAAGSAAGATSSTRTQIANYAVQFVGNPYVWGGTSLTNGADCSGFTMAVMSHFGVSLPHHSGSQANCGRSISSSEMRPCDLVFYSGGGAINHVALYIGNGQVVHASSAKTGIKISTWNYRTPVKIVNVLGD